MKFNKILIFILLIGITIISGCMSGAGSEQNEKGLKSPCLSSLFNNN